MIREKTIIKYYNSGYFLDLERKDSGQAKETAKKDLVPRIIQEERASVSVVERGGEAQTKKIPEGGEGRQVKRSEGEICAYDELQPSNYWRTEGEDVFQLRVSNAC